MAIGRMSKSVWKRAAPGAITSEDCLPLRVKRKRKPEAKPEDRWGPENVDSAWAQFLKEKLR